jgi:hypothetical protein
MTTTASLVSMVFYFNLHGFLETSSISSLPYLRTHFIEKMEECKRKLSPTK